MRNKKIPRIPHPPPSKITYIGIFGLIVLSFIAFIIIIAIAMFSFITNPNLTCNTCIKKQEEVVIEKEKNIKVIPINMETNIGSVNVEYKNIGILSNDDKVLELFGRPLFLNRNKWNYYAINKNNIRIPIYINGKDCSNEMGVDLLGNGDDILVSNGRYKATIYDDDKLRYIPVI